jgi:hypothetical protein
MIMTIFGAMVVPAVASLDRSSATTQSRATSRSEAQNAIETIARDLRAANPINAQSPTTTYDTSVSFTEYCSQAGVGSCASNNLRSVTYQLVGNQLQQVTSQGTRPVLTPSGSASVPSAQQRDAVINTSSQPVFTYLDKNGDVMSTSSGPTPADFSNCTKSVRIHLVVVSQDANTSNPTDLTTEVNLRNFNVVNPC